ncbi:MULTISPECIES: tRNA uridine-5-carboxymethylaminomethyl(34) synthesis enzyme MnmG [Peptoniphilus]|uniref:tRNA uridine-5-carboxymethylaminomethyl(34) synthesis enzyme MnmG n=1 Tax=Peptoniphilus TaxID=162289 RepID=UPI002903D283|nr:MULTISPECIES: tRNA uridine-5-carboxymethylaminomethyl(34) synthesis enzyme MnmG [Peptoniphilus]MDU1954963.1 tRNA uridine-5-carboxymethylaminomethyl(34) synthesis enzyme MnmG [Peptoniphilus lacydonensis]MDU5377512.1 tRNA uridine-5-carboxymethylaminomethyl(34) synthesis enzyme MnmG [Peptoniphilus lacydonensis]MDU5436115.1 tRNA uridine-5-carboxymethylaminomethyl(34) synthesis enzyme MnmG [Peptoniphilus lacydonensis]MDU5594756.1 tRNA uridine-5-carboxymethylaminomethyl(34) synthesis enzyme MnmG [
MSEINYFEAGEFDTIVIGAGHAGSEAALASARLGVKTLLLCINLDSIAQMSCNPNIGGTGKGHLVREIDALGGEMAKNIDKTFIQSRMLNTSKGPAVHSLRVQADKRKYHEEMKRVLENENNLYLVQDEAIKILREGNKITGVLTRNGAKYNGKCVIICSGTYLRARVFMGEVNYSSGPSGFGPSNYLSESLEKDFGMELQRLKTGTPARVLRKSIDYSVMKEQVGDEEIVPFSFVNIDKKFDKNQELCYLTYTTEKCHEIIRNNIDRSALALGDIEGKGPRYCPSIEDKVMRFSDRNSHQVFIEPEGLTTDEMYIQGVSSSLPVEVQHQFYKEIIGMENCKILRPAYAIEYDAIDATLLKRSLEHMDYEGLFFAGQINGSSGYEEAGAQGIVAGINAALKVKGEDPFILDRSEAYIGVLIDDLVTKGTREPYRMMTSRAEYRLTLRQDNADLRLTERGREIGLVDDNRYEGYLYRKNEIEKEIKRIKKIQINPTSKNNEILKKLGSTETQNSFSLYELIKRPELDYKKLIVFDPDRPLVRDDIIRNVEIEIKYEGYIKKQEIQINQFKKLENKKLSKDIDYKNIEGLRIEAREKLSDIRPESIGQASRITGVSPADINVLLIYLEQKRRKNEFS